MTTKTPRKSTLKPAKTASRLTAEQTMGHVKRILAGKEFANNAEMNAFLATLTGTGLQQALGEMGAASPSEEAQDLAYQAMEARTEAQAKRLAKRALAKDPDCIDALIVLTSVDANSPKQAIEGLQKAIAAGERSLGPKFFKENKGHFWGLLETRSYMRARQQLAELYQDVGLLQDAISHYAAMLELNPNDNQGVRDPLLGLYLRTGDLDGAGKLLQRYKRDASATFAWGRVLERLLAADMEGAAAALKTARKANPFMELYMSAQRTFPKDMPDSYAMGSPEEAIISLESLAPAWLEHPEAMLWLLTQILAEQPQSRSGRRGKKRFIQ